RAGPAQRLPRAHLSGPDRIPKPSLRRGKEGPCGGPDDRRATSGRVSAGHSRGARVWHSARTIARIARESDAGNARAAAAELGKSKASDAIDLYQQLLFEALTELGDSSIAARWPRWKIGSTTPAPGRPRANRVQRLRRQNSRCSRSSVRARPFS